MPATYQEKFKKKFNISKGRKRKFGLKIDFFKDKVLKNKTKCKAKEIKVNPSIFFPVTHSLKTLPLFTCFVFTEKKANVEKYADISYED